MSEIAVFITVCAVFVAVYIGIAIKNEKDKQAGKRNVHRSGSHHPVDAETIRNSLRGKEK